MSDFVVPLSTRRLFAVLLIYGLALAAIAWPLDAVSYRAVFGDDDGLFERLAPLLWLSLALACAVQAVPMADGRGRGRNLFLMAVMAASMAMREADWLDELSSPGHLRWVALAFVLAIALRGLWLGLRTLRHRASWREAWVWTLASGVFVALALEAMDLWMGLALDTYRLALQEQTQHLFGAWQRGFTCAAPLIFSLALWQWRRSIVAATPLDDGSSRFATLR
jgi:hypothetical protein